MSEQHCHVCKGRPVWEVTWLPFGMQEDTTLLACSHHIGNVLSLVGKGITIVVKGLA